MTETATTVPPAPTPASEPPTATTAPPTYERNAWGGLAHLVCLLCGHETWDEDALRQHLARLHGARMVPALAMEDQTRGVPHDQPDDHPEHPDHPHGAPPGQSGEHPQGGPPGQEPLPTHPMVEPEAEDDEAKEE